jgi:hypothetical protein
MSKRKIKKKQTRVKRPRGQHARNAEAHRRASGQAWLEYMCRPVQTQEQAVSEEIDRMRNNLDKARAEQVSDE